MAASHLRLLGAGICSLACLLAAENASQIIDSVEIAGIPAIALQTRAGDPLDPAKLQHDVKALWASGRLSDIRVEAVGHGGKVGIVFRVWQNPSWRLHNVEVTPPTPEFDRSLSLPPRTPMDPLRAHEIAAALRTRLENYGFPNAKVDAKLLPAGPGWTDLRVAIDKGEHIKIKEVALTGDPGVSPSAALRALHDTRRRVLLPGIAGIWKGWGLLPDYSQAAVDNDTARLQSYYYQRGFFEADVKPGAAGIHGDGARLQWNVRAGPEYAIRQFTLSAGGGMRRIATAPGGKFPAREVCAALLTERRAAERTGVLDFTASIEVREVPPPPDASAGHRKWADLTAAVQRGPAYRVGRIEFRGLHALGDATVRRMLLNREGEPMDEMLLRKTLARLNRTGMFEPLTESSAVINTPPGSARADIAITLKERKPHQWFLSGPAGPISFAGPLHLAIGSRLPAWGQGIFELSTYTVSMNLMVFAKPLRTILPMLPNSRFLPELTIRRPLLPGQNYLSGFVLAPQFGWKGMLAGYGISHARDSFSALLASDRVYTPDLAVSITHPGSEAVKTMYCPAPKTGGERLKQIGGATLNLVSSFVPF